MAVGSRRCRRVCGTKCCRCGWRRLTLRGVWASGPPLGMCQERSTHHRPALSLCLQRDMAAAAESREHSLPAPVMGETYLDSMDAGGLFSDAPELPLPAAVLPPSMPLYPSLTSSRPPVSLLWRINTTPLCV